MSLDGFIADVNDDPGRIHDWYFKGDTQSAHGFKLARDDAAYFDKSVEAVGTVVTGRRTYDVTNGWDGSFYIPVPIFVLTHKPPKEVPKGSTAFTFVTDGVESAIKQAKAVAHGKMVSIMGANVAAQCIEAGLLDELRIHVAPYLLGDGVRLFEHKGSCVVELKRTAALESSSGVMHLHYDVVRK